MRIAVFGAGYAGLTLARRLERTLPPDVELVVVDEDEYHLVQHEIHRAIRRPAIADDLRIPLTEVLDRADVRRARVTDVESDAGVATLADGETLTYDVGAVCLGAETAFYDLPGLQSHATPLKRLEDAARIRADFLDVATGDDTAQVVVGGAGLSGIQTAGELAALAREEGVAGDVEIRLLEQKAAVAPNFPERFQSAVHDELVARDVVVQTNATVTEATDAAVRLTDGSTVAYDQLIWTGGIRGPTALDGERPIVRSHLRLVDDTFVVGDAARIVDADGEAVPASAQSAVRAARVAADNVERLVEYDRTDRRGFEPRLANFTFDSPGWLVSIGNGAVAQVGSAVLTGSAAVALKTTVGAGYLSSVGTVHQAVDLVREEFGLTGETTSEAQPRDGEPGDSDDRIVGGENPNE
ncbi:NAD(P)/FAD-dependent oxidoreductase [Halorientalis brevis]|uniref:NAD(P)/FAD-dependent oxidoreductase n=1 Tax=Halorientalis brevis TaxID=1126241 RepID=A0ABD6CDE3_9EURY|nr:FAD-dependent oxidoreductase [Halorientalis brevis]